jgi:glyoxylase-like metal-dependent hydrolase (beta-lactamase superfamily II)
MASYTGEVQVGGPVDVRELTALTIAKLAVGPMSNNAYLLRCRVTGEGMLIDAADEADRLAELVRLGGDPVTSVLTTHQHPDHWQALAAIVARTGARTLASGDDADGIPVPTDEPVGDGDRIKVGALSLEVIQLVGHTPGSIALLYDDPTGAPHLFTGDSLFPGGVGNTRGNKKNFESLIHDVETKLFDRLPDETWVYPGHGADTTLGTERPALPEWRARGW